MPTLGGSSSNNIEIGIGVNSDTSGFDTALEGLQGFGGGILGIVTDIGGTLLGLAGDAITMAGQYEQTQTAFTMLLGNADVAKKTLSDLRRLALESPFNVVNVYDYGRALLASGFPLKDLIKDMTIFGDVAAGIGKGNAGFQDIIENMRTIHNQTYALRKQLNQLSNDGIPIIDLLAKHYGTTTAAVYDMATKHKILFQDVMDTLEEATGKGGMYADAMKLQFHTLLGQTSNFGDLFSVTMTAVGQDLIDTFDIKGKIADAMDALIPFIEAIGDKGLRQAVKENFPQFLEFYDMIVSGFHQVSKWINDVIKQFMEHREEIMKNVTTVATFVAGFVNGCISIGIQIADLVGRIAGRIGQWIKFFQDVWNNLLTGIGMVTDVLSRMFKFIIDEGNKLPERFGSIVDGIFGFFKKLPSRIGDVMGNIGSVVVGAIKGAINALIGAINSGIDLLNGVKILGKGLDLPHFDTLKAEGGPVSGGMPYIVGERGPEWFIPNNSGTIIPNGKFGMGGGGGGGVSFTLNNYINREGDMTAAFRDALFRLGY